MTRRLPPEFTKQMLRRIRGEYLETPGLRLNVKQAGRLWVLDEDLCARLLEHLVEARFLARVGRDTYVRVREGPDQTARERRGRVT